MMDSKLSTFITSCMQQYHNADNDGAALVLLQQTQIKPENYLGLTL